MLSSTQDMGFDIYMKFKTDKKNGLLLHKVSERYGDGIVIQLKNGRVHFDVFYGSLNKNISLQTNEQYSDNIEYALTAAKDRESKIFSLTIADEHEEMEASFGGGKEKDKLNTKNADVYLGKHPTYSTFKGII